MTNSITNVIQIMASLITKTIFQSSLLERESTSLAEESKEEDQREQLLGKVAKEQNGDIWN